MNPRFGFVLASVAMAALAGCASYSAGPSASAQLQATKGNTTTGTFTVTGENVDLFLKNA